MFRKLILSTIAVVAMSLAALAPNASAQVCSVNYPDCIAYPDGGLGSGAVAPTATSAPVVAQNVAATDTAGAGNDGALAFTGVESSVLGYAGAGLIGVGALALVAARRKSNTHTDLD